MSRWNNYNNFPEYVSVAARKALAKKALKQLTGKGMKLYPVVIESKKITTTFWGTAWCQHIESFQDYANRLPRGRSYVRNGSVVHLQIEKGAIHALVQGSSLYTIDITISKLAPIKWEKIKKICIGKIGSLIELIQGKLSSEIIATLCQKENGLFPSPKEIKMECSCPDYSDLCKHLASVLYGVGSRLDQNPELFFILRGVNQNELFSSTLTTELTSKHKKSSKELGSADIQNIFGIELDEIDLPKAPKKKRGTKISKKVALQVKKSSPKSKPKAQ